MKRDTTFLVFVAIVVALLLFIGFRAARHPGAPGSASASLDPKGQPAPDFTLDALDGKAVTLSGYHGQAVLLNFWATWCAPCVAETPDLVALYQKYSPDGLVIVGVSLDDSPDGVNPPTSLVSSFASNNGMSYPILMDRPYWGAIENSFGGIPFIPQTFVIDRQNHVWQSFVGTQTYSTFEQAVLPLLYANLALGASVANGQVHLSWPMTQATFGIESCTNLKTGPWTMMSVPIQSDGVHQYVDLPLGPGQKFFRLQNQ